MEDEFLELQYSVEVNVDQQTGTVLEEVWTNERGDRERLGDLPAVTEYCPDSRRPVLREWWSANRRHRDGDQPAVIRIDPQTRNIVTEHYMRCNQTHREDDKPAFILRTASGQVEEIHYAINGEWHRLSGPAIEKFDPKTGQRIETQFWVSGRRVDKAGGTPEQSPK